MLKGIQRRATGNLLALVLSQATMRTCTHSAIGFRTTTGESFCIRPLSQHQQRRRGADSRGVGRKRASVRRSSGGKREKTSKEQACEASSSTSSQNMAITLMLVQHSTHEEFWSKCLETYKEYKPVDVDMEEVQPAWPSSGHGVSCKHLSMS